MNATIVTQFDVARTKERLEYFNRLKTTGRRINVDKWIEIYQERLARQEKAIEKEARKAAAAANRARMH